MSLLSAVTDHFRVEAFGLGLNPDDVVVEPILNWGGFTNRSFTVSDGRRSFHLKLTDGDASALSRFYALSPILHERYRCPAAVAWIEIPGHAGKGILFERVDAHPTVFSDRVVRSLAATIGALHGDDDLRSALPGGDEACASLYLAGLDRRFQSDLSDIEAERPPFLTLDALRFMLAEADRLRESAIDNPAFAEAGTAPVHGDLWPNNVLTDAEGSWFLIDWDDLALGDPCLDLAMLTGPQKDDWTRRLDPAHLEPSAFSAAERWRIGHYHRALLLDWVIDPLADWIEAVHYPEWKNQIRSEKEREHRLAMNTYRTLYGA